MIRKLSRFHFLTYIMIAVIVAVVAIVALVISRNWQYDELRVLRSEKKEDTISSSYGNVQDAILQYGTDGARLQDRTGEERWSISYTIRDPVLTTCGGAMAIYDRRGTDVAVVDEAGNKSTFTTALPIVKACVAENGNVACIQEDDSNAWIGYYDRSGKEIASIKTSMDNPGYPMDLSISPNGELLAVAYLTFAEGLQQGVAHIYSFGTTGQNQMDNRIAAFTYDQKIVPELTFLDDKTCVVFRDNGFTVYEGAKVPKETREVQVDREIRSVFYDESHIGLILSGDATETSRLNLYNKSGGEMISEEIDFPYTRVELHGNEISLYNGAALRVYSLNGVLKFEGAYSADPRFFFAIGRHRYVAVTDTAYELLQLR